MRLWGNGELRILSHDQLPVCSNIKNQLKNCKRMIPQTEVEVAVGPIWVSLLKVKEKSVI